MYTTCHWGKGYRKIFCLPCLVLPKVTLCNTMTYYSNQDTDIDIIPIILLRHLGFIRAWHMYGGMYMHACKVRYNFIIVFIPVSIAVVKILNSSNTTCISSLHWISQLKISLKKNHIKNPMNQSPPNHMLFSLGIYKEPGVLANNGHVPLTWCFLGSPDTLSCIYDLHTFLAPLHVFTCLI